MNFWHCQLKESWHIGETPRSPELSCFTALKSSSCGSRLTSGTLEDIDLIPGGSDIPVPDLGRLACVHAVSGMSGRVNASA